MQFAKKYWRQIVLCVVAVLVVATGLLIGLGNRSQVQPTPANNVLGNPSFETLDAEGVPTEWQVLREGGAPGVRQSTVNGYLGKHALAVAVTDYQQGNIAVLSPKVEVREGERYRFSAMYRSRDGFDLVAYSYHTDGSQKRQVVAQFGPSAPWTAVDGGIIAQQGVGAIAFGFQLASNNHLDVDATYVVADQAAPLSTTCDTATNLIPNGNLQTISGAWPLKWEPFQFGNNVATNQLVDDNHNIYTSTTITDFTDGQAKWVFTPLPVQEAQTRYCFAVDYKATVSTDVMARFVLKDGSVQYRYAGTLRATGDWTRTSFLFEAPAGAVTIQVAPELIRVGNIQTDNYVLAPAK